MCECPITECGMDEMLDEDACACVTVEPICDGIVCAPNFDLNEDDCMCECALTDMDCGMDMIADVNSCECIAEP